MSTNIKNSIKFSREHNESEFFNSSEKIKLKQLKENIPSPLLWVNQQGKLTLTAPQKL